MAAMIPWLRTRRGWGTATAACGGLLFGVAATAPAGPPAFLDASQGVPIKFQSSGPAAGVLLTLTHSGRADVRFGSRHRQVLLSGSRLERVRTRVLAMPASAMRSGYVISPSRYVNRLAVFARGHSHEISAFPPAALGSDAEERFRKLDRRVGRAFRCLRALARHLTLTAKNG